MLFPRSLSAAACLILATSGITGCAQHLPRAALVDAAAAQVSRDVLGVANASDVELEMWLATEGSPLESATPRWVIDGPWKLPPGALWVHGQQAHEQTASPAGAIRPSTGRAFVCIRYADDPGAPGSWAEITRGGLGVKRPMTSPELVFLLMPRSMDEPLEVLPRLPSIGGVTTASLPSAPRQAVEVHETIAGLRMPLRGPAIVLKPQASVQAMSPPTGAPQVLPARYDGAAGG
jgi:hypothetical protein